jgi:prephenate dehydratase
MPRVLLRSVLLGSVALLAGLSAMVATTPANAQKPELAFLGPRGTYSEQAALTVLSRLGGNALPVAEASLQAVAEAVADGRARLGILPIAATTSSFPAQSHAALLRAADPGWRVVGEVQLPVVSDLLVKPGTRREDLRRVKSHPNALREASIALHRDFAGLEWVEAASTAAAAREVAEGDGTSAAVAGPAAIPLFGLVPLAEGIQDDPDNTTLFWVIGPADAPPAEAPDRLALTIDAAGGSAALSQAITALDGLGFRVVFVNSVPLPGPPFAFRYAVAASASRPVPLAAINQRLASVSHVLVGAYTGEQIGSGK